MDAQSSGRTFTLRCATVFVTEGEDTLVYRSMEEMPDEVRSRLAEKARGGTATIFIANRGGRDELAKRLRGLPSRVQTRLEETTPVREESAAVTTAPEFTSVVEPSPGLAPAVRHGLVVAAGLGLLGWLLASWK